MTTPAPSRPEKSFYEIRPLQGLEDLAACVALQRATWGPDFSEVVPGAILFIAQKFGGIASGAFDASGRLVGFVFGITGWENGKPVHWSDMLAVLPELRNQHLGEALKRHQRELLLPLGVETVYWTFEPLESKNAWFNLARLGVTAGEYRVNMYGDSDSPLHQGIGTDRLVAHWAIAGDRVRQRLAGSARIPAAHDVAGVPLVNAVSQGDKFPRSAEPDLGIDAPAVRIAIPADIQSLKRADPALAIDWRAKTRAALQHYIGRGLHVCELVRAEGWSSYVLERRALAA